VGFCFLYSICSDLKLSDPVQLYEQLIGEVGLPVLRLATEPISVSESVERPLNMS